MQSYKLVVLGDNGVGKEYDPTIEDSYRKQVVIDDQPCILEVFPVKGQYTALLDHWIRDGKGFLIIYSITSRSTFEQVERFRDQITRVRNTEQFPLILVGNKCDKITEREVSREEGMNMARRLKCEFIESSVTSAVNVERAFYTVVRMIRLNENYERENEKNQIIKKAEKSSPTLFLQKMKNFFFRLLS